MRNYRRIRNQITRVKLENGRFSNYKFIVAEEDGRTVGILEDENMYMLYDRIEVRADVKGFICESITQEGMGKIIKFRRNGNDHFYGVQMDSGEFGYIKSARIWQVFSTEQ